MAASRPRYMNFDFAAAQEADLPYQLHGIGRMVRAEEMRLLYCLARDAVAKGEAIVDAGAFLGGSTAALAAGLDTRKDSAAFLCGIHAYDLFKNSSDFYNRFLYGTVTQGESFLPHYLHNITSYWHYVNTYPGDFLSYNWIGRPIGLIFCDISKSPALDAHMWREFIPHMLPGRSVLVQQDFVHLHAPFVQITLGTLERHFDFLSLTASSLTLGYREEITGEQCEAALALVREGSAVAKVGALDALAERLAPIGDLESLATLGLLKVMIYHEEGMTRASEMEWERIFDASRSSPDNYFQARLRHVGNQIGCMRPE